MSAFLPKILLCILSLVHTTTGFVVAEFKEDQVQFNDRFLKAEMEEQGIYIPESMRNQFNGKEVIYLDDPLFQKAFIEVYYPLSIADPSYVWEQK